jgi:hypothetical protein
MPESHNTVDHRLGDLESWRTLVVDPALKEHAEKIAAFERIEMQIAGIVKFVKIVATTVGVCAGVCEIARALAPYFHK